MIILIIFGLPSITDHFTPFRFNSHFHINSTLRKKYYHSHKYTTKGKNGNLHKKPFFIFFWNNIFPFYLFFFVLAQKKCSKTILLLSDVESPIFNIVTKWQTIYHSLYLYKYVYLYLMPPPYHPLSIARFKLHFGFCFVQYDGSHRK